MRHPNYVHHDEQAIEHGIEIGYEDCMKEWLGFLRHEMQSANPSDQECIGNLIKKRWHVDLDLKDVVSD
jgi:hypothetical protein